MTQAVTLREQPRRHMGSNPDFDVLLFGQKVETAYFNCRGYRAGLPLPTGGMLDPGEVSMARLRREIAAINREYAAFAKAELSARKARAAA